MTAIKHTIQHQVFLPSEERLIAVVHVNKTGKKKKASFLCAAVTTEKPIQALVYQVKKLDRGDNSFKKKLSWGLRELKFLDAKDASKDTAEFDMQFDKLYKWTASSITEKGSFIQCLWKLSQRYLVQKPEFLNIPAKLLEESSVTSEADKSVEQAEELAMAVDTDYHALSQREETDLESLMTQCENAISNAEAFTDQLQRELSMLDGANIQSIMGSEEQVLELMVLLDEGLQSAMTLEEKLDQYDHKLQTVKDLMDVMSDKDTLLQVRNNNHQKLLETLDSMISHLDLDHKHVKALLDGDLFNPTGIYECSQAAESLGKCMAAEIHPSLERMSAVQEQRKRFKKLKTTFSTRLSHHLNNLFIHQGNELGETLTRYATELKLPQHHSSHRDLLPYGDLLLWLKMSDPESFNKLIKVYTSSLNRLYDREVKDFMDAAKQKIAPRLERKGTLPSAQRHNHQGGSTSSVNKPYDSRSLKSGSISSGLDSDSTHGSDPDIHGKAKLDQIFEVVLSELGPWCLAEQDFCVNFFHLIVADKSQAKTPTESQAEGEAAEDDHGPWLPRHSPSARETLIENLGSGLTRKQSSVMQRQINEEVRKMMRDLFPSLETELIGFIAFGDRLDSFNSLYMLMRMSEHVINAEDTGSFLSKTFALCLVHIKRNFDKFIQQQIQTIEETKLSKKSKAGVLPFVHQFADFGKQAEAIFKGSDRRTDLDKAYQRLVGKIFDQIERSASESYKTPPGVVMFENYHHMYATLSQLKVLCLESQRKEAKSRYQDRLNSYVTLLLGRPMEKLSIFFEGVQAKVASGVKEEEVGYQLSYSKQELRKVIKEYPGKEVKKNLEHLYRKVEKHLSEEEALLQVVWHSMQDEFLKQYKTFDTLIARCYPDSHITIEFTIGDLLEYFSNIAQSH